MQPFQFNLKDSFNFSPQITALFYNLPLQGVRNFILGLILFIVGLIALYFILKLLSKLIRIFHHRRESFTFLEITPPMNTEIAAVSTSQLFSLISGLLENNSFIDMLLMRQTSCALEIVSQKETGIRYLLRVPKSTAQTFEKNLRAYIPDIKVKETEEYLPESFSNKQVKVVEFKLSRHFSLPLSEHSDLEKHDPLAYLTGNMTQLKARDILAFQIVLRPENPKGYFTRKEINRIKESDEELSKLIQSKISKPIFEATVRALLVLDKEEMSGRTKGLCSSFASFFHPSGQSLIICKEIPLKAIRNLNFWHYKERLSGVLSFLSTSEVGSLYHFPFSHKCQTEDLVKVKSKELPVPLALKNRADLDVVFGKSTYGNETYNIGLTDDDLSRHVYLIGQTGSGKSTVIYHMAKDDINKGRGLAVIDPHGDLVEDLLNIVPEKRINDTIYFNPFDIKFPVGLNLLELTDDLEEDELDLEKELVCESVISIFRRVFFKDESIDAHRIEYILRNAIYTAFTWPNHTIFTVYDLLNDASFRKQAIKNLRDENLLNFWKNEFGKAGDFQLVKMASGVTAKVGRFLFSPIAKRILEQPKSTINFDDILDNKRILICNLAEGKLGEDTSQLLGATVIAKIHQAAVRRIRMEHAKRKPFYLFVDEFQNYATNSFTKLLSGGRKFGLRITIAEQSTAQQQNLNIVNVVLANTATVICFRTASPIDEETMLSQFAPSLSRGDIGNLSRFHFYMKVSASESLEPLSGITIPILAIRHPAKIKELVEASRKNYASKYVKQVKQRPVDIQKEEQEEGISLT